MAHGPSAGLSVATESAICELAIIRGHLTLVTLSNLGPVLSEFSAG
jgi:hypothetical protein